MDHLIDQLHSPANQSSPERINDIQTQIQRLQREKSAWQVGLELLHHADATVRFYGALTLTIKINADWDNDGLGADEQMRDYLLEALLSSYVRLTHQQDSNFVVQKLGSTLVTFFARSDSGWRLPIRHALACMLTGHYVPESSLPDVEHLLEATRVVQEEQLKGALMLTTLLAEDLSNHSSSVIDEGKLNARIAANCLDVLQLLRYYTIFTSRGRVHSEHEGLHTMSNQHGPELVLAENGEVQNLQLVLKAIPYWVNMIRHAVSTDTQQLENLATDCIGTNSKYLEKDQLTESVLQMIISLEQSSARLLRRGLPGFPSTIVVSAKAKALMGSLLQGDFDPEAVLYVDLLDAIMSRVDTTKPDYLHDQWYREILQIAGQLLRCEGVAVIEDPVCQVVLQRIAEVAEGSTDWEDPNDPYLEFLKALIANACEACLLKIETPPSQMWGDTQDWDADDRAKFRDFRYDVHDFLQSAFILLGNVLVEELVKTVLHQNTPPVWSTFEASLFSIAALFDAMSTDSETYEALVNTVLCSPAWDYMLHPSSNVPDRALQTGIKFIAENVAHLQRHPDKLIPILNFLFASLHLKASGSPASRAIYKLCDSHRVLLSEGLPQFMQSLASIGEIGDGERHRIYGAVAALIQALPSDEAKVQPIAQLLTPLKLALASLDGNTMDTDEILSGCTDVVQTLGSIGKGLRSPADTPVDLEAPTMNISEFWTTGAGAIIQQNILGMYHAALQKVRTSIDNIFADACCDFIKSGFTETHPSPFKFPDPVGLELMHQLINVENPSIDNTMACATSYLAAVDFQNIQSSMRGILYAVISSEQHILSQFQSKGQLPTSNFPPASLDFLGRCFGKRGKIWFAMPDSHETAAVAMELGLVLLADTDTQPRRSAAAFFAAFADFTGHENELDGAAKMRMKGVLDTFGARVLSLLLRLIGGECARSELESLSETLKRFVRKQPMLTKAVLREAVKPELGFMSEKALKATTREQRNRFIAQLDALRGAQKTNQVVKDFWIACRGSGFGYIS